MAADEYERRYLGGDEAVHREKRVSRKVFALMLGISALPWALALLSLAAFVFSGDRQGLGGAALMGTLALLLTALSLALPVARTVVTRTHLQFMVGLRNMAVRLTAITSTSTGVVDPARLRFDVAKDGAHVASIFFPEGSYVRVAWTDERGKANVVWIGSDDAAALRTAIDQARETAGAAPVRVESESQAAPDAALGTEPRVAEVPAARTGGTRE